MHRDDITLCAIMRNEGAYLLEWIAYHRLLGFDQIVIYSNNCSDGSDTAMQALADAGVIKHVPWENTEKGSPQVSAYNDALSQCSTEWIAFIDADEFIRLVGHETIHSYLSEFDTSVSAIGLNWLIFGSAGQIEKQDGLVIERFTKHAHPTFSTNRHIKTIARVKAVDRAHIHMCELRHGNYVDAIGRKIEVIDSGFSENVVIHGAQVFHYIVKSLDEFREKQRRGNANKDVASSDKYSGRRDDYFARYDRNEQSDMDLSAFTPRVQNEIERLSFSLGKTIDLSTVGSNRMEFDHIFSLGGNGEPAEHLRKHFGAHTSSPFDHWITPFDGLKSIIRNQLSGLFQDVALDATMQSVLCKRYGIYHQNDFPRDRAAAIIESEIATSLPFLRSKYAIEIEALKQKLSVGSKVLFVRSWREILHEGKNYPQHLIRGVPKYDFKGLLDAIETAFPGVVFQCLFVNYGHQSIDDPRAIFRNIRDMGDIKGWRGSALGWEAMLKDLNIALRGDRPHKNVA